MNYAMNRPLLDGTSPGRLKEIGAVALRIKDRGSWHIAWLELAMRTEAEQRWPDAASYCHGAEFYLPAGDFRNRPSEGEQDHPFNIDWIHRIIRELVCARSVTARIFTAHEGGEQRCQVSNAASARKEIIDWLSRFYPSIDAAAGSGQGRQVAWDFPLLEPDRTAISMTATRASTPPIARCFQ